MDIIVCVREVVDLASPVKVLDSHTLNTNNLPREINPFDLLAIEEAVRWKEKGIAAAVTIVSIGSERTSDSLYKCLAMGADRAILVYQPHFEDLDSWEIASILGKVINSLTWELVFCGQKDMDTELGLVGFYLAEILGVSIASRAVKIEPSPERGKIIVHRKLQRGDREVVMLAPPAVIAIEAGLNEPRYISRRSLMAARDKTIERIDVVAIGLPLSKFEHDFPKIKIVAFSRPMPKKIFVPDSSLPPARRLHEVVSAGVRQKKATLIKENPGEAASKLIQYLSQKINIA